MFHTGRKPYRLRLFLYSKPLNLFGVASFFGYVSRYVKHL